MVDVLYSAAGNTADDEYYNYGIIGWDFEVGADIYNPTTGRWSSSTVGFRTQLRRLRATPRRWSSSRANQGLLEDRARPTPSIQLRR